MFHPQPVMMDAHYQFATRDEFWRLQEELKDIYATQLQQAERISRLEKRRDEDSRMKSLWAPQSPFPGPVTSTPQPDFNPAAEAFKNFESESQSGMISSLHLDHEEDRRRVASRANSVRFDESAMNHYGATSRQSMDMLPIRTGSGMGMSERSYSHRSDGRASTSAMSTRANSFGLESSRLLGSANSPRASANPPPGFLFLGPVPSIVRCWLSDDFSSDSVLYAAMCTGSYGSAISSSVVRQMGLEDDVQDDSGVSKIKLSVYLTEATIQQSSSSRSSSPLPQVPAISVRFNVYHAIENERSIQVIIGSDVLRSHNADILFSEDRLLIFDEERNRLTVPLVRPESESSYRGLSTISNAPVNIEGEKISAQSTNGQYPSGIIRPPSKFDLHDSTTGSSAPASPSIHPVADSTGPIEQPKSDIDAPRTSTDIPRKSEDRQSITGSGSEKSFTAGKPTQPSGVWGSSWRSGPPGNITGDPLKPNTASGYSRANPTRSMKVLRPSGKTMASSTRAVSATTPSFSQVENRPPEQTRRPSQTSLSSDTKANSSIKSTEQPSAPTKANPIGQASAFGWLNSGSTRARSTTSGE